MTSLPRLGDDPRSYPTSSSVSTGMGDRLRTGIPSRYATSPGNSALHPSWVAKSSTSLLEVKARMSALPGDHIIRVHVSSLGGEAIVITI